jgi:hypothetical protein
MVSDHESDIEISTTPIQTTSSDIDNPDDEFYNIEHVFKQYSDSRAFLEQYNEAVNDSVEEYLLDAANYDDLTRNCTSPLFECLVRNICNLDDLQAGPKAEKTYKQHILRSGLLIFFG